MHEARLLNPDVLVIGAGPAGLTAALTAAQGGATVLLADLNPGPGGQLWRGLKADHTSGGELLAQVQAQQGIQTLYSAQLVLVEHTVQGRMAQFSTPQGACRVLAHKVILATGSSERFLPFPGWTLPGVVGAGGLQAMVKGGLDVSGARVVVAGSGPLLLAVAAGLRGHGARVLAVAEQAGWPALAAFAVAASRSGDKFGGKAGEAATLAWKLRGVPYLPSTSPVRAEGSGRLERVVLSTGHAQFSLRCDWLAAGFGLVPDTRAAALFGCDLSQTGEVKVSSWQATSVRGVYAAGELTGVGGADKARLEGFVAACAVTGQVNRLREVPRQTARSRAFQLALSRSFALRPHLAALAAPDTVVCRCEDVPHAALQGCSSWTEAKLYTRCGMGPCQGRVCGPAAETLYGWTFTGVRPPLAPLPISELLGSSPPPMPRRPDSLLP
ncbi:FAD-dependent oxidoreductase (plasmid) [Deinococcus radiomollis]|uniref:FAD-dependent oxidoreductase n=1 Tax=Deinococcus radiomollis TaxID=468916 RepID=UPI00389229DA